MRAKLILLLLAFSITPVGIASVLAIRKNQGTLEEHIDANSLELARLSLSRITEYIASEFENVRTWHVVQQLQ